MSVEGWDFSITERLASARDTALTPSPKPLTLLETWETIAIRISASLEQMRGAFEQASAAISAALSPAVTKLAEVFAAIDWRIQNPDPPLQVWSTEWFRLQHRYNYGKDW